MSTPDDPCSRDLSAHFSGVPGFGGLKNSLCINGKFHVPFGTMFWAPGSAAPGGMSMDFRPHQAEYAKVEKNFLYERDTTKTKSDALIPQRNASAYEKIGASATRTLTTNTFVGVEVGNLVKYIDVINYAGQTTDPSKSTVVSVTEALAKGGWGLPLCMNPVPTACPTGDICKVAVNCINSRMLEGDHVAAKGTGGVVARMRPLLVGALDRFYNLSAGGDTTPCSDTEYQVRALVCVGRPCSCGGFACARCSCAACECTRVAATHRSGCTLPVDFPRAVHRGHAHVRPELHVLHKDL